MVVAVVSLSFCIAMVPLVPSFVNFFVNGQAYVAVKVFIGVANKDQHFKVLRYVFQPRHSSFSYV